MLNRRKLCQQRVYNSYLWLLSSNYTDSSFSPPWSSMLTRHTTLEDPWKKLKKPLEHYFLKRKHLKNHWKRIKRIWIQMQRENCSYQLRSQPRRSTSKFSIDREMSSYYPTSLFQFRFSLRCLVRLTRSTKFLDRQCVRRSLKVSGGMFKTNYESNACLLWKPICGGCCGD